jgi:prepilin-type N-terminal cleavage/methylation domain-containing protein
LWRCGRVSPGLGLPAGVTLTEVLMSLMIMSIGISSVMVLFPISVLRSAQSTQLTNAAILKYNAETQIRQNPRLVFDPDGNYDLSSTMAQKQKALAEHFLSSGSRNYLVIRLVITVCSAWTVLVTARWMATTT